MAAPEDICQYNLQFLPLYPLSISLHTQVSHATPQVAFWQKKNGIDKICYRPFQRQKQKQCLNILFSSQTTSTHHIYITSSSHME